MLGASTCSRGFLFIGSQTCTHGSSGFLTLSQTLCLGLQEEPGCLCHNK